VVEVARVQDTVVDDDGPANHVTLGPEVAVRWIAPALARISSVTIPRALSTDKTLDWMPGSGVSVHS